MGRTWFEGGVRFDARLDATGGEDILLFKSLRAAGAGMVWCADAPVSAKWGWRGCA